jgi:hypothetical protein
MLSKSRNNFFLRNWRNRSYWLVVGLSLALALIYAVKQYQETQYLNSLARRVIEEAQAIDNQSRIIALRDFLRANVKYQGAPYDDRPFLRATAAETIQSGFGYCGEVTRAFICLADAAGIRAQRVNLVGKSLHVVAEAELRPGSNVIVDCQNPPAIVELEQLDRVILRPEYDDYYTLNLRRLRLNGLVSRIKMQLGPFTYWTENPHALQAGLWFALALVLVSARGLRSFLRFCLRRRGWIHASNERDVRAAVAMLGAQQTISLGKGPAVTGE